SRVEGAGGGFLEGVRAPQPRGAKELNIGAAPAEPLPRRQRQILYAANPDAAIDRHALGLHEAVVGHRRALELAVAGVLARFRFVPVHLIGSVVHGFLGTFDRAFNGRGLRARFRARPIVYTNWKDGRTPRTVPSLVRGSRRTLPRTEFRASRRRGSRPGAYAHSPIDPARRRRSRRSRVELHRLRSGSRRL